MNICVYGAASSDIDKKYIEVGEALGREVVKRGYGLVFGAGGAGMMGAAARGALQNGGNIIGIVPSFFNVDGILFDKCTEIIRTETMRERKKLLEEKSEAFIITAGGIGTMDELFEILTLKQLGRHNKPIVILNSFGFYDKMIEMLDYYIEEKTLFETVRYLYYVTDSITDAIDYIADYRYQKIDPSEYKRLN